MLKRLLVIGFLALMAAATPALPSSAQATMQPPGWVGIYTTAGKVGLKWTRVKDAARYKLYRTVTSGQGYELAATTTDVSFIDAGVKPGETYYYVLKTVAFDDSESPFSDERYIKVPLTGAGLPVTPPAWVGALVEEKRVSLAWVPSPSSNALAYNVYKSREKDKGFQLVGSTQDSTLTDTDVREGETYYYALTALDKEFRETPFSEVREVVFRLAPASVTAPVGPRGGPAPEVPDKLIAKPTRVIGYIVKGYQDKPLFSPTDIVIGPDGNLYVSDSGTCSIQVFKPSGEFVRVLGGQGDEEGKFVNLLGLDVDDSGAVYGVDAYSGRIQKFDPDGRLLLTKKMSEDGKAIAEDLGLKEPVTEFGVVKPVVSPDGTIYLLDNYNNCIEVYSPNGRYIKTFGGKGKEYGRFQGPTFADFGPGGDLYVVDCLNARVQIFDKDGNFLWTFGDYGNIVGSFGRPKGIFIGDDGRIYVADSMSNVIQAFDDMGRFIFILGDERGNQIDLGTPNGIVMDKKKRIYIVEKLVNRVQIRQVGE
ncbi:MAG: hypothetical protein HZA22_11790 [Nitrospirae bacterium]|nr:hypothetical protein [Nitrospirota bacterium]MBI5696462.1 hypothetical protein [Nitrospirota bacterium]